MNGSHRSGGRTGFAGRLYIAGLLIAVGLVVELATLFWTHPVSMTLFLCLGPCLCWRAWRFFCGPLSAAALMLANPGDAMVYPPPYPSASPIG